MNSVVLPIRNLGRVCSKVIIICRNFCDYGDKEDCGFLNVEEPFLCSYKFKSDDAFNEDYGNISGRRMFIQKSKADAAKILDILRQDGPGFDAKSSLDELQIEISGIVVRKVLIEILTTIDRENKSRCAKLGFKFFIWSGQQPNYKHTVNAYNLIIKIFSECDEFKAMWRLLDEMTKNNLCATARTFNIMICSFCEAGLAKKVVERFVKSKTFNFRPFRHSYNAIMLSLFSVRQYRLIEWVHEQMVDDNQTPDTLTYNIIMYAKYRLGKLREFHILLDSMGRNGISPDFHTYNILLHVLGKGDKPIAAVNLLNHMKEVGVGPSILHFTTLMDGLSRAGNLEACKYFFDEMGKEGCEPDVVCYTVMIASFVAGGELEKAQKVFDEMIAEGKLPNVFTYNSMIRGLCMKGKFEEACLMLKEMEARGCEPNFLVYSRLFSCLRNAGRLSEAHQILRQMMEKGKYSHLVSKAQKYNKF